MVFGGLTIEYKSVITMATFSSVSLQMELLVEILIECEIRQHRFVIENLMHANLVQRDSTEVDLGYSITSIQGGGRILALAMVESAGAHPMLDMQSSQPPCAVVLLPLCMTN